MNFVSVYIAVNVIGLVRGEVGGSGFNALTPAERRNFITFHEDDWNRREVKETNEGVDVTREEVQGNQEDTLPAEEENKRGQKSDFLEGLEHFKNIYYECKRKVNKRVRKLFHSKVKSKLERYLSESKEFAISLYKCVKVLSFRHLDQVLEENFIPVTDYAYFIKDGVNATEDLPAGNHGRKMSLWTGSGKSINEYATSVLTKDWNVLVFERLDNLLRSHSLKFQVDKQVKVEGRGRRRDHRMFAMMVMGFMIMASILIPMGFQFLTVLGGKSLLMAKMALIMSAINGLKKIATSNVGYGFYHTGNDGHHHDHIHHGFHEKMYSQGNPSQYGFSL